MVEKVTILFFLFLTISIKAQEDGINGEILLKNGSIQKGFIVLDDSYNTPNKVSVSYNGAVQNYKPEDVISVEVDDRLYVSKMLEIDQTNVNLNSITGTINEESVSKHVFLKKVVDGVVSLLTFKDSRVHFFAEKGGNYVELIREYQGIIATASQIPIINI